MPNADRSTNLCSGPALITLMAVQIILGYEWLASGVTKVASGSFVSGMGADLKDRSQGADHWYKSFLDGTVLPNARTFAVLIEVGEVIIGVAFIAAAVVWLARWDRLSDGVRISLLVATMAAAVGGIFMAINFHLANAGNHPWLIPKSGLDETIDLDMFIVGIQGALFAFSGYLLVRIRREHRTAKEPASVHGAVAGPS